VEVAEHSSSSSIAVYFALLREGNHPSQPAESEDSFFSSHNLRIMMGRNVGVRSVAQEQTEESTQCFSEDQTRMISLLIIALILPSAHPTFHPSLSSWLESYTPLI
jgi:hypothetical protein